MGQNCLFRAATRSSNRSWSRWELADHSLAAGPSSGTRRGWTRLLRIGPVTSQAAPTRPPQPPEHRMRRSTRPPCAARRRSSPTRPRRRFVRDHSRTSGNPPPGRSRSAHAADWRGSRPAAHGRTHWRLPYRERKTNTAGGRVRLKALADPLPRSHPAGMFVVTDAEAAAIRAAYEQAWRVRGRGRVAPAVPRRGRQRQGPRVRSRHRRLAAAACVPAACQTATQQAAIAGALATPPLPRLR